MYHSDDDRTCHVRCAECGKELPSLAGCWWRHYYQSIEVLCPKCARAQIDERTSNGLMSADILPPRI